MATGKHSTALRYLVSWRRVSRAPIYEWAQAIEMDTTSPIQGNYDISNSPQFKEPLDSWRDERVRMITTLGPNQGGRTKTMEIASLWSIVNRPGPMQWNTYKNESAREFAEQRWWPTARSCAEVVAKLPKDHDRVRIQSVIFDDGMPFKIQGCAESNLEEKSIMTQFNDECWQWPVGRLKFAHIRCNVAYAWNYKVWNGSVAGIDGDDIDLLYRSGQQREWHWHCLKCGEKQIPIWRNVKWERDKTTKPNDREWDLAEVAKTVRYECPHCHESFSDNPRTRRLLNADACYYVLNPAGPEWHPSFRFNILSVNWPGITWAQWVVEFLLAVDQQRKYRNLEPLKAFWTRRMTEPWDEARHASVSTKVVLADYNLGTPNEYRTKQWEGEKIRFIAVDKQEWGYPFVIRAVKANGDSRLIECGVGENDCLASYDEIDAKSKDFGIHSKCVIIDAGYEAREVYAMTAKFGWTCMRGVDRTPFRHPREFVDKAGMQRRIFIELPYSAELWSDPFTGTESQQSNRRMGIGIGRPLPKLARRFDWINLHIKNLLSAFKQGQALYWGVPGDVGPEYLRQMNSEVRHRVIDAKGRMTEWWSNRNEKGTGRARPNHAWDCECMIVVAMCLQALINLSDWTPELQADAA